MSPFLVFLSIPEVFKNAVKYLFARIHPKDMLLVGLLLGECYVTNDYKISVAYQKHFFFFLPGLWGCWDSSVLGCRLGSGPLHISLIFLGPEGAQDSSHGGGQDTRPSQTTGTRLKSLLIPCPLIHSIGQNKSDAKSNISGWGNIL